MSAQFVDPSVSRVKFERELEEYRILEDEYRRKGWLLLAADYPRVLIALAARQLKPPAIVTGVAFDYTNYDAQPPSVRLVNPFTGEPYKGNQLPTSLNRQVQLPGAMMPGMPEGVAMVAHQPLMQAHSPEDVPFLCIAGVREYHEHPAHTGDAWELHRASGAGRLVRLLDIIYRYGVQPVTAYQVTLTPQITGFAVSEVPL